MFAARDTDCFAYNYASIFTGDNGCHGLSRRCARWLQEVMRGGLPGEARPGSEERGYLSILGGIRLGGTLRRGCRRRRRGYEKVIDMLD